VWLDAILAVGGTIVGFIDLGSGWGAVGFLVGFFGLARAVAALIETRDAREKLVRLVEAVGEANRDLLSIAVHMIPTTASPPSPD
jgi:hypothetical protein